MEPLTYFADLAAHRVDRRRLLQGLSLAGASWLTPLAELLARDAERCAARAQPRSVILLWLAGGPSQLETFDPHPGHKIAAGTTAINTSVSGLQLADGLPRLAGQMMHVSLVRSVVSKEGDHERGTYLMKTGYRPEPTLVHPSLGAICCHRLPIATADIPRHVSILSSQWPARGGFLGDQYDAFKTLDPAHPVPNVLGQVPKLRQDARLADLAVVNAAFGVGRRPQVAATLHAERTEQAAAMMSSAQLRAFDVGEEPAATRAAYGETPFGRGCLAALRLIQEGVRCVEVTLSGWDSHANNHEVHAELNATLDPAFAALVADLAARDLLDETIVVCCGEFGRTPKLNPLDGRDHWPHGFSLAIAGGGLRGGQVIGETDPDGGRDVVDPRPVADVHATILTALGIDPAHEEMSPAGRPVRLSTGVPIAKLLADDR